MPQALDMNATGGEERRRRRGTGIGIASGTCGELVQGAVGDRNFMITFPVNLYSKVEVTEVPLPPLEVWPPGKIKAKGAAAELIAVLAARGNPLRGVKITVSSPILEGKGFASSSADVIATCRAVADLVGARVTDEDIGSIACSIEPTDWVMADHPVVFDFIRGRVLHDPGRRLPVIAVAVDPGGTVDTLGFTRLPYTSGEQESLREIRDLAVAGLASGDIAAVGKAATVSARINQRRLVTPHLAELERICAAHGGVGVCVAHSGVIGAMLFDERDEAASSAAAAEAESLLPGAVALSLRSPDCAGHQERQPR